MRSLKVSGIIHLFAVLHAVVALSCHLAGINDELVLTLLTIVLIVLICLKRGLNVEFTAASVIVVNVIGYLLGTGGAQLIELLLHAPPVVHAVSTFITTEILGWSIVWFTKLFRRGDDTASRSSAWTPRIGLLLLAVGVIFVLTRHENTYGSLSRKDRKTATKATYEQLLYKIKTLWQQHQNSSTPRCSRWARTTQSTISSPKRECH